MLAASALGSCSRRGCAERSSLIELSCQLFAASTFSCQQAGGSIDYLRYRLCCAPSEGAGGCGVNAKGLQYCINYFKYSIIEGLFAKLCTAQYTLKTLSLGVQGCQVSVLCIEVCLGCLHTSLEYRTTASRLDHVENQKSTAGRILQTSTYRVSQILMLLLCRASGALLAPQRLSSSSSKTSSSCNHPRPAGR